MGRWQFLLGKFLGLLATLTVIVAVMSTGVTGGFTLLTGRLDWGLVVASLATLLEIMIVIAVALFFSSLVVTPSLAGMFTAATFIAGRSATYLLYFLNGDHQPAVRTMAHSLYWVLPRLDRFTVADQIVYGVLPDPSYLPLLAAYAAAYAGILLVLSIGLFARREFV